MAIDLDIVVNVLKGKSAKISDMFKGVSKGSLGPTGGDPFAGKTGKKNAKRAAAERQRLLAAERRKNFAQARKTGEVVKRTRAVSGTGADRRVVDTQEKMLKVGRKNFRIQKRSEKQGKKQAKGFETMTEEIAGFRFGLLSTLFAGQALSKAMFGLLRPAFDSVGVFEVLNSTLEVAFLPTALGALETTLGVSDALLSLGEGTRKAAGDLIFGAGIVGSAVSAFSQLGLVLSSGTGDFKAMLNPMAAIQRAFGAINSVNVKVVQNLDKSSTAGTVAAGTFFGTSLVAGKLRNALSGISLAAKGAGGALGAKGLAGLLGTGGLTALSVVGFTALLVKLNEELDKLQRESFQNAQQGPQFRTTGPLPTLPEREGIPTPADLADEVESRGGAGTTIMQTVNFEFPPGAFLTPQEVIAAGIDIEEIERNIAEATRNGLQKAVPQ